ncbi:uncharacterized protein LOC105693641 isoform X1 [Athalia rosae]|uniref:uncharacterized protein LOC105693641 isoform X1 n=1 Tax=Athalia rosae TaxID=37344 RepID=UPI002033333B|nr:uncharacterized protein LOC105693641 isoform X1 [Athalia rosae]
MATHKSPEVYIGHVKGVYNSIYKKTPNGTVFTENHPKIWHKGFGSDVKRNKEPFEIQSHRKSGLADGIHLPHVSHTKAKWDSPTDFQLTTAKRLSRSTEISIDKPVKGPKLSSKKRLSSKTRPFSSLFSYSNKTESPQVSLPVLQKSDIQHDMSPIRPSQCAISLCQNKRLVSRDTSSKRNTRFSISGRFSVSPSEPSCSSRPTEFYNKSVSKAGLDNKPGKVCYEPYKRDRVSRNHMEYNVKRNVLAGRGKESYYEGPSMYNRHRVLELGNRNIPSRKAQFRIDGNPFRKIILASTTEGKLKTTRGGPKEETFDFATGATGLCVVAAKHSPHETYIRGESDGSSYNRCLKHGLGFPSGQPDICRNLVAGARQVGNAAVRQQNGSCLHTQTRGNSVSDPPEIDQGAITHGKSTTDSNNSLLPTRALQHPGGQSVKRATLAGLACVKRSDEDDLQEMGHTTSRLICNKPVQSSTKVCNIEPRRPRSILHKCLQQEMGHGIGVGFSSTASNTEGSSTPERGKGFVSGSGPKVGEDILERRLKEQEHSGSDPAAESRKTPDRHVNGSLTTERQGPLFRGLENTGWGKLVEGLVQEDVDLLYSAWRDSTWKTYSSAWKQWYQWCETRKISPGNPTAQQLASYLGFLFHTKKQAFRTILTKKSVINTIANPIREEELGSHPLVKSMLKAISVQEAASVTRKTGIWNVEILIQWLKDHPPDENSIYQISRHTATLLLLASGRRVHDLTLLAINSENCTIQENVIVFWPKFGSKTDSARHRQSGWKLSSSDHSEIDLIKWVKLLISVSASRRRAFPELVSLFITTRGKVKAASRTVIAGWIKTIFAKVGIDASPGSVRSAVASYNYENEIALDALLQRSNWKGAENFFKHYCKFVEKPIKQANNPLFEVFEPI